MPMKRCHARGCRRRQHPDSYYGRCGRHMWCRHCDLNEVRKGTLCPSCIDYRRRTGELPPPAVLKARARRQQGSRETWEWAE